ncbi:MAG: hypothetical protein RIQ99_2067, partial [Pseudomonadota bacterium]
FRTELLYLSASSQPSIEQQTASYAEVLAAAPAGPIVVTGESYHLAEPASTKTGTRLIDTPQSVTMLQREQLDDQGVEQLNDALRYVPGITLGQGEGHRDQVVLRGQSSTADFFLDGLRDDAQYYRPLYNIERVEVLKGANALLFGRGGGGGIINRVAKVATTARQTTAASAGFDSWGAWSIAGDLNQPLGESAALRLNATYEDFANHRDSYDGHFIGIAPTLHADLGPDTALTLAYEFDRDHRVTDRGVPALNGHPIEGYDNTFFGSPELNRSRVDAHIARGRIEHTFSDTLSLNIAASYADYDKYYANILPASATASTVTLTGYDSGTRRGNWIGQANLVWHGHTGPIAHTVLAGIEAGDQTTEATRRNALFDRSGGSAASSATVALAPTLVLPTISWSALTSATRAAVHSSSAYLQDQIEFAPWLQVIGGLRHDRFAIAATNQLALPAVARTTRTDTMWSPRLGLIIKPRANLSLYASYAKSSLPQAGDQFTTLDASYQTLAPEAFRNLELGAKWDITPALAFTGASFQVDRSNTRANDPLTGSLVLTGATRVRGIEVGLAGRITRNWQINLGYTYQTGTVRMTTSAAPAGRTLDKLPAHQLAAWTRYNVSNRLGMGLGVVRQSAQYATISNAVRLPGFTRIDAAAFYNLNDQIGLQLNVENLTNIHYFASAHTDNNIATGEPLNAKLTLRVKY